MSTRTIYNWPCRDRTVVLGERTLVMGILNVTPDSFSDGGDYSDPSAAVDRALEMVEQGADIIDIGGESTRPGSDPVSTSEEIKRTVPVIENFWEAWEASSKGTVIKYEGYLRTRQTQKYIKSYDPVTGL